MPDINMQVFEEAQRNQLVTEVDIQTQVALDDYQVKFSNIDNLTQSQDNVVIDRHGEFLPHWNESLDFDTWIKMSMEVAGKRILMLRGNSSVGNASNGPDVFLSFFYGDSTGWTEVDPNSHITFVNNRLEWSGLQRNEHAYVYQSKTLPDEYIIEYTFKDTAGSAVSAEAYHGIVTDAIGGRTAWTNAHTHMTYWAGEYNGLLLNVGGTEYWDLATQTNNVEYFTKTTRIGNTITEYLYTDADRTSLAYTSSVTKSGMPNLGYVELLASKNDAQTRTIDGWLADFKMRKYTATEPSWSADCEQNIAVALKSLGRAG